MKKYFIALGSNWSNKELTPEQILQSVVKRFFLRFPACFVKSSVLVNNPLGPQDQPQFCNQVIGFESSLLPNEMLCYLKGLEVLYGRKLRRKWGERELDLDILSISGEVHDSSQLKVPHPEMIFRSFVLNPLKECDPNWIHPVSGKDVDQLILELDKYETS